MADQIEGTLIDKIMEMKALQARMDKGKALLSELQEQYDKLRLFDIPNMMAEQDTTSVKGQWGRCTLTGDLTVKVLDKAGLHEWLESNEFGDLIVPQVNAQTLKAFIKEQLIAGGGVAPVPETIVTINPFSRAVLYKN